MHKIIGLTGGIGSGKSYVARILEAKYGIPVYDCDREAKRLNNSDPVIIDGLKELVGNTIYNSNGELDKAMLADFIFTDIQHLRKVNALIHPRVMADFRRWASARCEKIAAFESAILFESGFDALADVKVSVTAPIEIRIKRIIERDHTTETKAKERICSQMDEERRIGLSDFVIVNDGSDLNQQIDNLLRQI